MRVVKVELEGTLTSFRYAHFLIGRQPSYPMPPPSTIYGHICSAVGDYLDPSGLSFGYSFQHRGRADDLEHIHVATLGTGRTSKEWPYPKNLEVNVNPTLREVLVLPKLTLYLHSANDLESLSAALREPRYPVALGRSQDLAGYRSVSYVELVPSMTGYFEGTLLPDAYRGRTTAGFSLLMPQFIDPNDRRNVTWARFVVLEGRAALVEPETALRAGVVQRLSGEEHVWTDPESAESRGERRIVVWHRFIGSGSEVARVAAHAG